jgi:hypothetical protein
MLTIRNLGGVALLAMGSTWLWLTPAFAGRGVSTTGVLWSVTRALALITVAAFCVATWGLFARHSWWEAVAMGAAVVHLLMLAGLVLLLEIPWLEQRVDHHVMSGR